jgi:hypothetical protein
MRVRLTQVDGKLPNIALMKIAHHHRKRGDEIVLTKNVRRGLSEGEYDRVYGSAIFAYSAPRVAELRSHFPQAIVGGTWNTSDNTTVEQMLGLDGEHEELDYSIYDGFSASIGFTQRGCRLKCGFCVVPKKEGKPRSVNTIADIWRGEPWPKHLYLLDNDFFGQPREQWQARIEEIRSGGFKACLNQGINIRMIDDESAAALASIPLYDDAFKTRRLYTAWDNIGDEDRFFRGVDTLERHGIRPQLLMVYMLIGYDKRETWERVLYRFDRMVERRIRPYPMVYGERDRTLPTSNGRLEERTLAEFQRWAVRRLYTVTPFEFYDGRARTRPAGCQPRAVLGEREVGIPGGKAGPGRGKKTDSSATRLGRGRAYILARLDRDRPDLAAKVRVKKLTANSAAVLAGFRRKPTPLEKILNLLPRLASADRDRLRRELAVGSKGPGNGIMRIGDLSK